MARSEILKKRGGATYFFAKSEGGATEFFAKFEGGNKGQNPPPPPIFNEQSLRIIL